MKIFTLVLALILSSIEEAEADAPANTRTESYWPMHDSGGIDHDLKNRWNDPVRWCGAPVVDELIAQMAAVQHVVVTKQSITLFVKNAAIPARESLMSAIHSYGFWRLSAGRTLVITLSCKATTVCTLTANLIVHDGTETCLERWHTVAYRGERPK